MKNDNYKRVRTIWTTPVPPPPLPHSLFSPLMPSPQLQCLSRSDLFGENEEFSACCRHTSTRVLILRMCFKTVEQFLRPTDALATYPLHFPDCLCQKIKIFHEVERQGLRRPNRNPRISADSILYLKCLLLEYYFKYTSTCQSECCGRVPYELEILV